MCHLSAVPPDHSSVFQMIDDNNNNKYISGALNPSASSLPEAQSAVHVQLKLSKLHIQLKPSKQGNQQPQKAKNKQKPGMGE